MDIDGHRVFADGTEIALSRKEFDLLCVLLQNAGRVVSRRDLLDAVWCPGYPDENKTLEVHIRRLRRKLDPGSSASRIRTVRGIGYIFDVEAARLTRHEAVAQQLPRLVQRPGTSEYHIHVARRSAATSPASTRTRRWWLTVGWRSPAAPSGRTRTPRRPASP